MRVKLRVIAPGGLRRLLVSEFEVAHVLFHLEFARGVRS